MTYWSSQTLDEQSQEKAQVGVRKLSQRMGRDQNVNVQVIYWSLVKLGDRHSRPVADFARCK